MSRSAAESSRNGTSMRTPISCATCGMSDHMSWRHEATAPSWMLNDSSGTSVLSSTFRTMPVPEHVRQAPAPLNASSSARGSHELRPHSGQREGAFERDVHRGRHIMAVRAYVACQAREHQAKHIEQLGRGAERGMHAGSRRTLTQARWPQARGARRRPAGATPARCGDAYRWKARPDSGASLRRTAPRAQASFCPTPTRRRCPPA